MLEGSRAEPNRPATERPNLWKVEDTYAPTNFYVKASNSSNHSDTSQRFKVHPEIGAEIGALIESKAFPIYQTAADFYRDAIVHRLAFLRDHMHDPRIRDRLDDLIARKHLDEETEGYLSEFAQIDAQHDAIERVCTEAIERGDYEAMLSYLERVRDLVSDYRNPHRDRLLKLVDHYEKAVRDVP